MVLRRDVTSNEAHGDIVAFDSKMPGNAGGLASFILKETQDMKRNLLLIPAHLLRRRPGRRVVCKSIRISDTYTIFIP